MRSEESDQTIALEFDAVIYFEQVVKSAVYDLDITAHLSLCGYNDTKFEIRVPGGEPYINFEDTR